LSEQQVAGFKLHVAGLQTYLANNQQLSTNSYSILKRSAGLAVAALNACTLIVTNDITNNIATPAPKYRGDTGTLYSNVSSQAPARQ
jgi:hypothetical protein